VGSYALSTTVTIPAVAGCLRSQAEYLQPKHQYQDGQLCLFNPMDGAQYGWNPARSTAVTVVSWAIEWIYALYTWRATGHWPGAEESMYRNPRWPSRRAG
jgi:hypothetical protein